MPLANTDQLASLADRPGWKHTAAGWINKKLDITASLTAGGRYLIAHNGTTRELTSATGALCVIDTIERRAAE